MTLDERVAYLEGRLEDHSGDVTALRGDVQSVRGDIHALRGEMQAFRTEVGRQFTWIVGIQIAMLVGGLGALLRQ